MKTYPLEAFHCEMRDGVEVGSNNPHKKVTNEWNFLFQDNFEIYHLVGVALFASQQSRQLFGITRSPNSKVKSDLITKQNF